MGRFPVISISLKSVSGLTFEAAAAALRSVIGDEAARFSFLEGSARLSADENESYRRLVNVELSGEADYTMSDATLIGSLKTLSRLLSKHYGRKVILLIDEYDVPLDKAFQRGYYDQMVNLIRNMFDNALKTNDFLYFAVLTGCLRISKESIFTGLNNLNVMTISEPYFCDSFGFTEKEVMELLQYYGLESYHDIIRSWYDGYQFGDKAIYCPWDVIKYVQILLRDKSAEPENYWANTSGNELVRRLLKRADQTTRSEIERLLNGECIVKPIRQELTYREIDESIDNIWSVLYSTGYLTQRRRVPGKQMKLALPNREIRELFADLAKDWFQETALADCERINKFCGAFVAGDTAMIQDMMQDYLWDSISIRDTAVQIDRKENFYHGMVLGLLRSQGNWLIQSNAETGEGYSDISVCTPEGIGFVIEIKYAHDGRLEKACAEALRQIEEKKYVVGLQRRSMKKVIRYGLAFWEKECKVLMA